MFDYVAIHVSHYLETRRTRHVLETLVERKFRKLYD